MNKDHCITICRICKNNGIENFFDLGFHPLANSLLKDLKQKEKFYPLCLCWCSNCKLVQLNYTVDPKILFSSYFWITGTSKAAQDFSVEFYKKLIARTENSKDRYVLEIASNDGTFLKPFISNGYKVCGVDPAKNIVKIARNDNIPTLCEFWGKKSAVKLKNKYGLAQIIFARNVLAHVDNICDFMEGIHYCLSDDGTLAIEVHYAGDILKGLQYDSIYHEHIFYFTIESIDNLFKKYNLFIFDIQPSPISGGAIVIYAKKKKMKESPMIKKYKYYEFKNKINGLITWKKFADNAIDHKEKFIKIINKVKNAGNSIIAWGASARSSTLLNFCKIDSNIISVIADQNRLKHKHYTAGSHILIDSPDLVIGKDSKFMVILAWNLAKEIIETLKNKFNYSGIYIIPLPNKPIIKNDISKNIY